MISYDAGALAYDEFTGRWSRLYVDALLAAAAIGPGDRVLDVATGTGDLAHKCAQLVAPTGWVLGADIAPGMLRVAQAKGVDRCVTLVAMDGQALACRNESFDVILCQLGLMFFADVMAGLREFRRVLRPDGRIVAQTWSEPDRVPFFGLLAEALSRQLPEQRGVLFLPSTLADAGQLDRLFLGVGFRDVRTQREARKTMFASFDEYWAPIERGAARLGQLYLGLAAEAQGTVRDEVWGGARRFNRQGQLVMTADALIVSARR